MNQDFALLATPANARRLLLWHQLGNIQLAPEIAALAEQDRIDEQAFDPMVCPYTPDRRMITQFLLDAGLRGVVQTAYHPEFGALALLNTIRLATPDTIIVLSGRRKFWKTRAEAFPLTIQTLTSIITLERQLDTIDHRSVIVYDITDLSNASHLRNIVREFPRIILYDDREFDQVVHWPLLARILFPTMPHPLYARILKETPHAWAELPLSAFAAFYNVCIFPHLITAPSILTVLEDDYILERIKYYTAF